MKSDRKGLEDLVFLKKSDFTIFRIETVCLNVFQFKLDNLTSVPKELILATIDVH